MRSTADKIRLFGQFFRTREDVYGTYDPATGRVWQAKAPVTERVLLEHLRGQQPYGPYLLQGNRTGFLVIDFDIDQSEPPARAAKEAETLGLAAYVERSKSKGYHVWVFFAVGGVPGAKARVLGSGLTKLIGEPDTEVFPKQDALSESNPFGNFINAPLFGQLVPQRRTVFVDPAADMQPFPDQWDFLEQITPVTEEQLDQAIEALAPPCVGRANHVESMGGSPGQDRPSSRFILRSALPICAQRMLNEGVTENQRVACFRLAIHFNRLGLPFDITVAALREWAHKNHPADGKQTIADAEVVEQADWAYKKAYRGFGCDEPAVRPFCSDECPLSRRVLGISGRGGRGT